MPFGQDSFSPQGNTNCKEVTEESKKYNLCNILKTDKNYHPAEIKNNSFLDRLLECYNEIKKPINFTFDSSDSKYKSYYEKCRTNCSQRINGDINNCIKCDIHYIIKP